MPYTPLTVETLMRVTAESRRGSKEPLERQLSLVTHVPLTSRDVSCIGDALREHTPRVTSLYLQHNALRGVAFARGLHALEVMYLQGNRVRSMLGTGQLASLTRVFLDGNRVSEISGLDQWPRLEELHLANQSLDVGGDGIGDDNDDGGVDLPPPPAAEEDEGAGTAEEPVPGGALPGTISIRPGAFAPVAQSLRRLDLTGNGVTHVLFVAELLALDTLILTNNAVEGTDDDARALSEPPFLRILDLRHNPCTKSPQLKWRERAIVACSHAEEIDGKMVKPNERIYLARFHAAKRGRGRGGGRGRGRGRGRGGGGGGSGRSVARGEPIGNFKGRESTAGPGDGSLSLEPTILNLQGHLRPPPHHQH